MSSVTVSPARKQYLELKKQFPDAILMYQVGDFYETFDEDAYIASRELQIVRTTRCYGKGEPKPADRLGPNLRDLSGDQSSAAVPAGDVRWKSLAEGQHLRRTPAGAFGWMRDSSGHVLVPPCKSNRGVRGEVEGMRGRCLRRNSNGGH